MSKRPSVDLSALTADAATPMPEAVQRAPAPRALPQPAPSASAPPASRPLARTKAAEEVVRTADMEPLHFRVTPAFDKRFRRRAFDAGLKLKPFLGELLAAWEEKHGFKDPPVKP